MTFDRLMATIEEYLSLKQEIGITAEFEQLGQASKRIELALKEYLQNYFDRALLEDRIRSSSMTTKVNVIQPEDAVYSYNDIVKVLDLLNSAPIPLHDMSDDNMVRHWMAIYSEWFLRKKKIKIQPTNKLSLDLDDLKNK